MAYGFPSKGGRAPWHALTLALFLTVLGGCHTGPGFHGADVSGASYGRDFHLRDPAGRPRSLADFRGKVVFMFFGYTQCPDVCPTNLSSMAQAMKQLGADADRVQVLFVTVDPERDTPELLANYVPAFDRRFLGLYGDAAATAATANEFKVYYHKRPGGTPDTYTVDHSAGTYLFDPQGRLRLYEKHGEMPENLASDTRLLLAGK
ncbi:MAG: SCO family protein [Rhodocyclaceae bacterium]|nr:SCO family protein [Rhodocyclaceae bacterium]